MGSRILTVIADFIANFNIPELAHAIWRETVDAEGVATEQFVFSLREECVAL